MKERLAAIEAAAGEPPVWAGEHAAEWSKFLNTPIGKHLALVLAYYRPTFDLSGNPTKVAIGAGRVQGFELALQLLFSLREADRKVDHLKDRYPALDDDNAWAATDDKPQS